jgi:hypothetical protein
MEWTKSTPSKLGYYWIFDEDSEEPELVKVISTTCHYDKGLEIVRLGSEVHDSILLGHYAEERRCSMFWFGPLELNVPDNWRSQIDLLINQ